MKIGVLAPGDPLNVHTWSGTPYFMTKALQEVFPSSAVYQSSWFARLRFASSAVRRISNGKINPVWWPSLASRHASLCVDQFKKEDVDIVFCIANSPMGAFISNSLPTVHVSDATVPLMRNYYERFSSLSRGSLADALALDAASARQAVACLYSSRWAAESAISDYGVPPARVHTIPWGCNFEVSARPSLGEASAHEICNLLFIGREWERKGGDIAVETARVLHAKGFPVRLELVGSAPPYKTDSFVNRHGFLSKANARHREILDRLFTSASFLFLPSRQDCTPMIFAEANAHGVPAITTATGGIASIVENGVNGYALNMSAEPTEYASLIEKTWLDEPLYERLRRSSYQRFNNVLNWKTWAKSVATIVSGIDRFIRVT